MGFLGHRAFEWRDVSHRGNFIFAEVRRRHLAVVDNDFLHKGVADASHRRALDLSLVHQWIQHRAGVVRGSEFLELNLSGFTVNLHLGNLNAHRC